VIIVYRNILKNLPIGKEKSNLNEAKKDYENGNIKTHETVDKLFESLESIWNLPNKFDMPDNILIRLKNDDKIIFGTVNYEGFEDFELDDINPEEIKEYCTLTDFISHIESLEQRIKKLEEK